MIPPSGVWEAWQTAEKLADKAEAAAKASGDETAPPKKTASTPTVKQKKEQGGPLRWCAIQPERQAGNSKGEACGSLQPATA